MITPASIDELAGAVLSTPRVLAVGAQTKPRLSAVDTEKISTSRLRGIVEYDPDEFTFTALAGTPVHEIAAALAERGQYLPFDPMLSEAGATLGGTVAAGLSGPGRFRFGGVRDFILGIRFVDGAGRLLRMGGKVVKNAAGFDLPKFFVGSLGRFGVLAEVTFKVFPRAAATRTLKLEFDGVGAAAQALMEAASARWECDALDILPDGKSVLLRLAAPESALDSIVREVLARWPGTTLSAEDATNAWTDIREFRWVHDDASLIKAPITPGLAPALHRALDAMGGARLHVSAGGDVAFLSTRDATVIDRTLRHLDLKGVTLLGSGPLWCGTRQRPQLSQAVKEALDPQNRFPSLTD
jgi:glycolate oxidase FAD binding subunit